MEVVDTPKFIRARGLKHRQFDYLLNVLAMAYYATPK